MSNLCPHGHAWLDNCAVCQAEWRRMDRAATVDECIRVVREMAKARSSRDPRVTVWTREGSDALTEAADALEALKTTEKERT